MSKPMSFDEIACRTMDNIDAAQGRIVTLPPRIESSIERDPLFGCWIWTGPVDKWGYGTYWGKDGPRQAHRVVYVLLVGEPPPDRVLDHWCRRRKCVRPAHLEPVTRAENDRRRIWRYRARMTTCPRGHTLSTCITTPQEDRDGAGRLCRTCMGPEKQ